MDSSRIQALEISEPASADDGRRAPGRSPRRLAAALLACAGACALVASAGSALRGGGKAAPTALVTVHARENVDGDSLLYDGVYDENGCVPTAGYSWCNHTQRCYRPWEEACLPVSNTSDLNGSGAVNHSLLGGVYDEHGCVPTAGFSWCNHTQRCFRPWEEACLPVSNNSGLNGSGAVNHSLLGGVYDEHGCVPTAGFSWCNHTQRCFRPWEEACLPGTTTTTTTTYFTTAILNHGGLRDENGCIPSAGYSWCNHTQRCHRPWEEACLPSTTTTITYSATAILNHGGLRDENGCIPSAGYVWCNHTRRCHRPWEEACLPGTTATTDFSTTSIMRHPGGLRDENGCIPSAGYSWCNHTQRCHRPWEEACLPRSSTATTSTTTPRSGSATTTATATAITGGLLDENGCIPSAGYSWCNHTQRCYRPWEESCDESSASGADRCDHAADHRRCSPSGLRYPAHWGAAPAGLASRAVVGLPGRYGSGSYELRGWILAHQHADAASAAGGGAAAAAAVAQRPGLRGAAK